MTKILFTMRNIIIPFWYCCLDLLSLTSLILQRHTTSPHFTQYFQNKSDKSTESEFVKATKTSPVQYNKENGLAAVKKKIVVFCLYLLKLFDIILIMRINYSFSKIFL